MTRTGTLQAGASQTMALAGVAELSPSAGVGPLGELVFSDVLADQTPLRPGALSAPMTSTATLPTQTQTDAVSTRVGERGWDQGLGDKLVWMTSQKRQVAELSLNPPELGPLKITIRLDQNQASAQFVSAHASVREAIESAMPKLREMLAESGITLGNASVGTEGFREPAQQQQAGVHPTQTIAHLMGTGTLASGERQLQRARGLVDTFA
jgi:flagellar hook-length control protein FliK